MVIVHECDVLEASGASSNVQNDLSVSAGAPDQ
jgi:hypothetical protein